MDNKIKLNVLGFSFNQKQSGTYGLVMSEETGLRRLMIVVGAPEAQSIAFVLQNVSPPRPLAHDLIRDILDTFSIMLCEVIIDKYEEGVFYSKLILQHQSHFFEIDSRTSDAIAVALRLDVPIYTTENIMREMAVIIDNGDLKTEDLKENEKNISTEDIRKVDLSLSDINELQTMLDSAIETEDYEFASVLRDELRKKKKSEE